MPQTEASKESLFTIVYVSSATGRPGDAQLMRILETARHFNGGQGITGMLLYRDGSFMQALEGPAQAVRDLYLRIRLDPRHRSVTTLVAEPLQQREFADWSMGFHNLDDSARRPAGISEAERVFFSLDRESQAARGVAYRLLAGFRDRALA